MSNPIFYLVTYAMLSICWLPLPTHCLIQFTHPVSGTTLNSRWIRIIIDRDPSYDALSIQPYVKICLTVTRHAFFFARIHPEETTGHCFPVSSNDTPLLTTNEIEMKIKGNYTALARVVDFSGAEENILYTTESQYSYDISEECKNVLATVQPVVSPAKDSNQYNGGAYDPFETTDPFNDVQMNPICMDEITALKAYNGSPGREKTLGEFLSTASGFRGTFGVDFSAQEFGQGDNMMLHYIMSRNRNILKKGIFVEMGCFAGVTSLTLGIAASLRGVDFHAFDIVDMRPPNVVSTWLPNMHHHVLDLDICLSSECPQLEAYLSNTSFLMVDANHVTRLQSAVHFGNMLRENAVVVVHDFPAFHTIMEWKNEMGGIGYELVNERMRDIIFVSTLATFERKKNVERKRVDNQQEL